MKHAFLLAACCLALATPAFAYAVVDDTPPTALRSSTVIWKQNDAGHLVVNWTLCVNEADASSIVSARAKGAKFAEVVYAKLNSAQSCGVIPQMTIRREMPLSMSSHGTIYKGQILIPAGWANAFFIDN